MRCVPLDVLPVFLGVGSNMQTGGMPCAKCDTSFEFQHKRGSGSVQHGTVPYVGYFPYVDVLFT